MAKTSKKNIVERLLFMYNYYVIFVGRGGEKMKKIVLGFLFVALLSFSLFQKPTRNGNRILDGDIWFEFVIAFSGNDVSFDQ